MKTGEREKEENVKSGGERRKCDAETNFLWHLCLQCSEKHDSTKKLAFSQLRCNPSYENFFSNFAPIANPVFLLPRTKWSGVKADYEQRSNDFVHILGK